MRAGEEIARTLLAVWPWGAGVLVLAVVVWMGVALYRRYRRHQSEERFGALFEAAPGALVLMDEDRRVLEVNAAACELLGRATAALRGRRLEEFLQPAGAEAPKTAFEALDERHDAGEEAAGDDGAPDEAAERPTSSDAHVDACIEQPDGTVREVQLRLRVFTDGGRRRTAATLRDTTPVAEERALFRHFHRRTVEDLPIEMAVLSPEGTYLYANPLACTDEIAAQWLEGKTDFDLCRRLGWHPEVALRRRSHRRRALRDGERVQFEEVLSRRDAPPRHLERFYTPIYDEEGEVHAVVTYALDRTRLKRREDALEEAERASDDYEDMKTSLLRNLRHEFRTPLTSILGAAEVLTEEAPPDQQEFVEIVDLNGQRLLRTLNAMLDLAGAQTGSLDREPRVVSLGETVENVIGELQETAEEKGLFLRKQAPSEDAFVRGDPASLYRVVRSIVGNAVKFTDNGGVVVEVETEAQEARLRVIDTGVGIDDAHLPQLFDSFAQEDASMTRHFDGAGVGLAVTKRLLDLMGGTVSVDSKKGEGSVFTVALPMAFRDASGERPHVLVADEQEDQHKLLRHRLDEQVRLTFARDLDEALDAARGRHFAAVLVSAGLSSEVGAARDLAECFRALGGYEETPLIVIDDDALPGAAEQFEAEGFDGYVARPLKRAALLNALGDAFADAGALGEAVHVNAGAEHVDVGAEAQARVTV